MPIQSTQNQSKSEWEEQAVVMWEPTDFCWFGCEESGPVCEHGLADFPSNG
jgi:hypothetical protein